MQVVGFVTAVVGFVTVVVVEVVGCVSSVVSCSAGLCPQLQSPVAMITTKIMMMRSLRISRTFSQ